MIISYTIKQKGTSLMTNVELVSPVEQQPKLQDYAEFMDAHPEVEDVVLEAKRIDRSRHDLCNWAYTHGVPVSYDKLPARKDVPGYLGTGWEKAAYAVGDTYVAKVLNRGLDDQTITPIKKQVEALEKGLGVPGLEQIVTADQEGGVIVTELVKGKPIADIPSMVLAGRIKPRHLEKLRATLEAMKEHNLECDNVGNVMFDPTNGFTIIDYRAVTSPEDEPGNRTIADNYNDYLKDHSVEGFLAAMLPLRKRSLDSLLTGHGDRETKFVKSAGRGLVTMLVPKHKS